MASVSSGILDCPFTDMAVFFWSNAPGLTRIGAYLTPSIDWTMCGWYRLSTHALDAGFTESDFWFLSQDNVFNVPWIWMGAFLAASVPTFEGEANVSAVGAITTAIPPIDTWMHLAMRYKASTTTLSVVVNGIEAASDSATDLSGMSAQPLEEIGPASNGYSGGFFVKQVRTWQQYLSEAQLLAESQSDIAIVPALADTPLANWGDLSDISGNGRDFSMSGAVFVEDFSDKLLRQWNKTDGQLITGGPFPVPVVKRPLILPRSLDDAPMLTCSYHDHFPVSFFDDPATIGKNVSTSGSAFTDGTIRFQFAALLSGDLPPLDSSSSDPLSGYWMCDFSGVAVDASSTSNLNFRAILEFYTDGTIALFLSADGGYQKYSSSVGAFPVDGTMHGFQIVIHCPSANATVLSVWMDNVEILSGSYTTSTSMTCVRYWGYLNSTPNGCPHDGEYFRSEAGIVGMTFYNRRSPNCGVPTVNDVTAIGYVEFESAAIVRDFPSYAVPPLTVNTCTTKYTVRAKYNGESPYLPSSSGDKKLWIS